MGKTVWLVLSLVAVLGLAGEARAWTALGTSSGEDWLLGSNGSGHLVMCNRATGSFITWPGPGGVAPAEPLTENGLIDMRSGNDRLEVVVNDGSYPCGYMYAVDYGGYQLTLKGGAGNDALIGGLGIDIMFGDATSDVFDCMEDDVGGADFFGPRGGSDSVYGCGGDDTIVNDYAPGAGSVFFGNLGDDCIENSLASITIYCTDDFSYDDGNIDRYESSVGTANCSATDPDTATASLICTAWSP